MPMNRREAIAALMSLPATTRISVANLKPEDVIVLEFDGSLSEQTAARLKAQMETVWPGRKVLVMTDGLKLKIVSG